MIYKRLLELDSWVKQEDDRVSLGREAAKEASAVALRQALSTCFQAWLASSPKLPADEDGFAEAIGTTFVDAFQTPAGQAGWTPELAAGVRESLANGADHERPAADWLIATALFDALIARARPEEDGVNVARLLATNATRVRAFAETVQAGAPEQLQLVVDAMRAFVRDECSRPAAYLGRGSQEEHLKEAGQAWAKETDMVTVWDSRAWRGIEMYPTRLGMLTTLAALKPAQFLPLIEEVHPLPLQDGCFFWRSISQDLDKVLGMLDEAPTVVDQQSGQWNRKVVASLLLQAAWRVITDLGTFRKDNGDPQASPEELAEIARLILQRALKRPDGVQLVSHWMRHLVYYAATRDDDAFAAAFNASLEVFAGADVAPSAVYPKLNAEYPKAEVLREQLAYDEGYGEYQQLLLAGLLVQERVDKGTGNREPALRTSLLRLMCIARQPFGVSFREVMPTWRHRVFADVYLADAEPQKAWLKDFEFFSPERRAAVKYSYYDDNTLMAPSLFLAGVGLSLIDQCLDADESTTLPTKGLGVWTTVFDATRLMFTHWNLSSDAWRNVAASLFARLPACLRAAGSSSEAAPVEHWVSLLGRDEGLVATALANLLNNDMDPAAICGGAAQLRAMKERMGSYVDWEGGAGSRALNNGVRAYIAKNVVDRMLAAQDAGR